MTLLLVCPPAELRESWSAYWIAGGRERPEGLRPSDARRLDGPIEQWPPAQELMVVVPAALLSWHRVTLPRLPKPRWPQALAGLLEDQLLSDPAQVHMALAPSAQAGAQAWVAVCDKAWLQQAIEHLQAAGRSIDKVVPEFEPGASALHLIGQADQAQLVHVDEQGVLVMPLGKPMREALLSWAPTLPDAQAATLTAEPALADLAQQGLHRPAQLMGTAQRLWQAGQSEWNLAQFDLAARPGRHRLLQAWAQLWRSAAWRPLRWGLMALILVQVLGLLTWAWQESSLQQSRQQELQALLRSSFPQVKLVIDPVLQMRREVLALALASGSPEPSDLGVMLSVLAEAGAPPIQRLDYSAGELKLGDWPLPAAQAAGLQSALAMRGYLLQGQGQQWQMKVRLP